MRLRGVRSSFLSAVVFFASVTSLAQRGLLSPVPKLEAENLTHRFDAKLLPPRSHNVAIEPGQVFRFATPELNGTILAPVRFEHGEPDELMGKGQFTDRDRCGVFLLRPDGKQNFAWTIRDDQDLAVSLCSKLKAVQAIRGTGAYPRIKLTYRTYSPPRFEDTIVVYLEWNATRAQYEAGAAAEQ